MHSHITSSDHFKMNEILSVVLIFLFLFVYQKFECMKNIKNISIFDKMIISGYQRIHNKKKWNPKLRIMTKA